MLFAVVAPQGDLFAELRVIRPTHMVFRRQCSQEMAAHLVEGSRSLYSRQCLLRKAVQLVDEFQSP